MKKLMLPVVLLLSLSLASCFPPNPIEPEPVVPDPVLDDNLIEGVWFGIFSSFENFFFEAELTIEQTGTNLFTGIIELTGEEVPTFGDIVGQQVEENYFFEVEIVDMAEVVAFSFNGYITGGYFLGQFSGVEGTDGTVNLSKRSGL